MVKPEQIKEIKDKKKNGVLNHIIMQEYNLTYSELRTILDEVKTDDEA